MKRCIRVEQGGWGTEKSVGGREGLCVCVIESDDKSGSEEGSKEERDDPFRGHDSAGGPK